jgi:hypothetical protein
MAGNNSFAVEKLLGKENYHNWKISVKAALMYEGLWTNVVDIKQENVVVDADKDVKAYSKLILLMHPRCFAHVQNENTARGVWRKLQEAYEDNGLYRKVSLLRKLIKTSLKESGNMENFVNDILNTAHELNSIGFKIEDDWIGTILLAGLPESFKPMILGLESSGIAITGETIKVKLLQEKSAGDTENVAFFNNRKITCHNCGLQGHIARNCRKKKKNFVPHEKNVARGSKNGDAFSVVLSTIDTCDDNEWYFDSACSSHYTKNEHMVNDMKFIRELKVSAANGAEMNVVGIGNGEIFPDVKCGDSVALNEIQYVPDISANLLSVSKIVEKGNKIIFSESGVEVFNPRGDLIANGVHENGLFKLSQYKSKSQNCYSIKETYNLWHNRMGHLNERSLKQLKDGLASGIKFSDKKEDDCKICPIGKQSRLKFNKFGSRASNILDVVHSDLCGPMPDSLGNNKWFMTFIDDFSMMK